MKKSLFYIILSFILTLAVTEYVWIELLREEHVVAEIETETEVEEDLKEESSSVDKQQLPHVFYTSDYIFSYNNYLVAYTSDFKDLRSVVKCNRTKLFILHHQLRVHC